MTKVAGVVSESVAEFKDMMHRLDSDAKEMSELIEEMGDQVFVIRTKIDHIIFKSNVYNAMVEAKSDLNLDDYSSCRLTKWYTSEGKKRFGSTASYQKLQAPHRTFHDLILQNLQFIKGGDHRLEQEERIIENFVHVEEAGRELFMLLDSMREEIHSTKRRNRAKSVSVSGGTA